MEQNVLYVSRFSSIEFLCCLSKIVSVNSWYQKSLCQPFFFLMMVSVNFKSFRLEANHMQFVKVSLEELKVELGLLLSMTLFQTNLERVSLKKFILIPEKSQKVYVDFLDLSKVVFRKLTKEK